MFPRLVIKACDIHGIYALTPDTLDTTELLRLANQALLGGVRVLQYRNKLADGTLKLAQAQALRKLTYEFGVVFIVNDDAQLAARVDADGVHLGKADGETKVARTILGANKLIGVSCYNQMQSACNAVQAGADYVAFGAFFSSSVKPEAPVASLYLLIEARAKLNVPIVAIGGIDEVNGAALVKAGANALAVISGIFGAADVQLAAKNLVKLY